LQQNDITVLSPQSRENVAVTPAALILGAGVATVRIDQALIARSVQAFV
jgi:hypothetical protein